MILLLLSYFLKNNKGYFSVFLIFRKNTLKFATVTWKYCSGCMELCLHCDIFVDFEYLLVFYDYSQIIRPKIVLDLS